MNTFASQEVDQRHDVSVWTVLSSPWNEPADDQDSQHELSGEHVIVPDRESVGVPIPHAASRYGCRSKFRAGGFCRSSAKAKAASFLIYRQSIGANRERHRTGVCHHAHPLVRPMLGGIAQECLQAVAQGATWLLNRIPIHTGAEVVPRAILVSFHEILGPTPADDRDHGGKMY